MPIVSSGISDGSYSNSNNKNSECFNYLSEDTHLYETIAMLCVSSAMVYGLNLPILYKSLVISCRKEFKGFNRDLKFIETVIFVIQAAILAMTVYNAYKTNSYYPLINTTTIASTIQIWMYYTNSVLGCLLFTVFLGYSSCGAAYFLFFSDVAFSTWLHLLEGMMVYVVAPILFIVKFNYSLNRNYLTPYSKLLGIWIYIQFTWSINEGLSILSFSNLENMLCPSRKLIYLISEAPTLPAMIPLSYRIPLTVVIIVIGYCNLHGYIALERGLKYIHLRMTPKS